jgi:DNA-binding transcriptional LysR family regulator
MRVEDLQCFISLCQTGQMSRAATKSGVTQSAISKTLVRLEEEFGVPLLERVARGVIPTPAGERLLQRAQQVLCAYEGLRADMSQQRAAQSGQLRIGALPVLTQALLLPMIARFLPFRPMARFHFDSLLSAPLFERLHEGKLDLAFVALPQVLPASIAHVPLGTLRISVVARSDHPRLAQFHTLQDLCTERWALPSEGLFLRNWLDERMLKCGLPLPEVVVQSETTPSTFATLLRHSDLLGIAATIALRQANGQDLCALEGDAFQWTHDLGVIWRKNAPLHPLAQEFRDQAVAWSADRVF